jgi:hypothetical protein
MQLYRYGPPTAKARLWSIRVGDKDINKPIPLHLLQWTYAVVPVVARLGAITTDATPWPGSTG